MANRRPDLAVLGLLRRARRRQRRGADADRAVGGLRDRTRPLGVGGDDRRVEHRAGDGAGLLVLAGLSDRLGEERTAGASLVLCGLTLAGAVASGTRGHASLFVAFVAAAAFFRSPVFAIFPSLVGRYYGEARSSENYAAIYTAKVPGGVFGGTVTGALIATLGWSMAFYVGAVLVVGAGLAAFALRPVGT